MQPETYKRSGFLAIKGKKERKEEEDELNLEEVRQEGIQLEKGEERVTIVNEGDISVLVWLCL